MDPSSRGHCKPAARVARFSDESASDIPEVDYPRLYSLEGAVAYLTSKAPLTKAIYRHFSDVEAEPVPPHIEVEGHITPLDHLDIAAHHQWRAELTLHLADGRVLDFLVADEEGAIRSTGRGLRTLHT